jgi:hypothetical protein
MNWKTKVTVLVVLAFAAASAWAAGSQDSDEMMASSDGPQYAEPFCQDSF